MSSTKEHSSGFTLIELLVVIAMIGLLAAMAYPQIIEFRQRGFDTRARSDLKSVAQAEEAYYATYQTYTACNNTDCATKLEGFKLSNGVSLEVVPIDNSFTATSSHPQGTGAICRWESAGGGLVGCS
jgi:type IV pilus assembly protein PilA